MIWGYPHLRNPQMASTIKGDRVSACHADPFLFSAEHPTTLQGARAMAPKGLHMNQDNRIYPHSANIRQTFKPIRAPSFKGANKLQRSIMVHHPFPALIPFCALGSSGTFGTSGAFGGSGTSTCTQPITEMVLVLPKGCNWEMLRVARIKMVHKKKNITNHPAWK